MKRQYLLPYLLISAGFFHGLVGSAFAGMNTAITCSPDMAQYQCNTCFDGGFLYEGKEKTTLYDIAKNTGSFRNVYFAEENGADSIQIKNRGGSGIVFTTPIFDYHTDFFALNRIKFPGISTWAPMMHPDGSVKWGTIMDPGASYKWTETLPGKELYVTSVDKTTINDTNRSLIRDKNFVVVYSLKTQFRDTATKTWQGSNTHVECQQIGIHFCGDGIVESAYGEQCDDGGQNGQPGKCNTSCTAPVPPTPTPSCDSISAIPTFGASPLNTTLTCNGSNLPTGTTYAIDCGNGTNATMNGNKGSCTYINTSTTNSATYGAKCTINNTITSQACQMNIGVNPIPAPPVCNPAKTGTQTAPVLSTDPLCTTGTPSGFVPSGTNPIQYAWSCNNASQSVACTASYTPSNTGSGAFDLSIKKYIETNDAQPDAPVYIQTGSGFNYIIRVKNEGTGSTVGTTTIRDILPVGLTALGAMSGSGWTCGYTGTLLTCTSSQVIQPGAFYPDITIPVERYSVFSISTNPSSQYIPKDAKAVNVGSINIGSESPTRIDFIDIARTGLGNTGSIEKIQLSYSGQAFPATVTSVMGGYRMTFTTPLLISGVVTLDLSVSMNATANEQHQFSIVAIMIPTSPMTGMSSTIGVLNTTSAVVTPGSGYGTVPLPETASPAISGATVTSTIQNNAVVHNPNEALPCYADNRMPTGNESVCTNDPKNTDPAIIRVGVAPTGFDLSLKKYIISGTGAPDAQPGSPLSVNTGDHISYLISVTNSGPQTSSGVTTVQDILPVGVTASGSATGLGWSCAYSGVTLTCTSSQIVGSGASYPLITVPVIVTATAGQSVTNIAAVDNPNETNRCNTDGSMPANAGTSCNKDPNNSDPAVITIPGGGGGGGGGGASHVGASCVNSIKTCALYNSITACEAVAGVGNCDSADAPGQARCAAKMLTCSGPGGPTPGSSTNPNGRCGDGVLGSSAGEECDVIGVPWCSSTCKVLGLTNPGANPIMDLWMTIPVLAGTKHLGYTWLDGTPGKVPFSDYRMVLGVGTKAFTLADTVGFGIRTQFQIPIMIEESKKICITSTGSSLSPQTLCTTFGEAVVGQSGIHRFQRFDGTTYVVLGNGDYQYQTGATFPYQQVHLNGNSNNINLFRGATQYTPLGGINLGPTLNSAFFGAQVGNDGVISLVACTGTNCAPTATVELVKFDVRVSSAMVSSIGSSSNRSIESFVNMSNPFTGFLGTTSMNTSTTGSNRNNSTNTSVNLPTIVGTTGNQSSSGVTDLERFSVNGNRNILAISGSLTIENCPNNTFVMTGIRTVIVTGDLVIKCNIGYGTNNDASWAWITKNGNIKVYNGTGTPNVGAVTNLAGVFVAVKDSAGGDITYTGSNTTQAILRIEGSLYGDATPLFNSRLYGRATGAYDILTTGTVISYSNRALVSPPPLLSQYLGAYSVQRVVQ